MNFNPAAMPGSRKCFFVEKVTDKYARSLRRYVSSSDATCPLKYGYHNVEVRIEDGTEFDVDGHGQQVLPHENPDLNDSRWPTTCGCGYVFTDQDPYQVHKQWLYRNGETGEEYPIRELPVGAMYYYDDSDFYARKGQVGPDGKTLVVMIPSQYGTHPWHVDSRASNCTMPEDNVHKCWVRHGTPPSITVDKNGITCAAGAGSIVSPDGFYHGFLQEGYLTNCPR